MLSELQAPLIHPAPNLAGYPLPIQAFFFCQNLVVAVSAEGWFHLFDLTSPSKHGDALGHPELLNPDDPKLAFKQHIPANTKVMLIDDIGEWMVPLNRSSFSKRKDRA